VKVGGFSAVGLGANVVQKVTIGEHTVLGAGATLLKDLPGGVVAYGVPARVVRGREIGERYL
jgi:acetyltransferase-like isoleucine patch superfamily enzyme